MNPQPASWVKIDLLILSGNKIAAIKEFREQTGSGLKEAKDAVEAREIGLKSGQISLEPGPPLCDSLPADSSQWNEIDPLIFSGQKIQAIKAYRGQTRSGLKEAKEAVEARQIDLRLRSPQLFTAPEKTGCLPMVLFLLGAPAVSVILVSIFG